MYYKLWFWKGVLIIAAKCSDESSIPQEQDRIVNSYICTVCI